MPPPPFDLHFIHGFLGDPTDWDPLRSALGTPRSYAHALLAPIVCKKPSILVGYSMGGRAVLRQYFENPTHICGLIFLSSNLGLGCPNKRAARCEQEAEWITQIAQNGVPDFIDWWYTQPLFAKALPHTAFQKQLPYRMNVSQKHIQMQLEQFSIARLENYWEKVSEIQVPTYFLFGEHDTKYHSIYKKCGALRKKMLSQCGHMLHLEAPEACAQNINAFIEETYAELGNTR